MLAEQVWIGGFWNLAIYGIGSRGKRKHQRIPIWQGVIGDFCIFPCLVQAPELPYGSTS